MRTINIYFHLICVFAIGGFIFSMVAGLYKVIVAVAVLMTALAAIAYVARRR